MSTEKMKMPIFSDIPHLLSDDKVSLITLTQGQYAIRLELLNQEDTAFRCFILERSKRKEIEELPPFRRPSSFTITSDNKRILIHGNLDELIDAAEILFKCIQYISTQKRDELIKQLNIIHRKEVQEQNRKTKNAQGQEKHREKYLRLAEKYGLDPNLIFANPESALKKSPTSIPAHSRKSPKTK